jgi:N-methylhydantoinase A
VRHNRIVDVGPRSAHIANLGYASFTQLSESDEPGYALIQPRPGDPSDYVMLAASNSRLTITPTCAANLLGYVPKNDAAHGNLGTIRAAFAAVGKALGVAPDHVARQLLDHSYPKAQAVVEDLIADYELDRELLTLSGGGGGAIALVPYTAEKMNLPFEIAPNAPVISAIGAALAMVRDTVERTVVDPTETDVLKIRREAEEAVVRMGANPETVEVQIEIDPRRNVLRAMATGSTELRTRELGRGELSPEELEQRVRQSVRTGIQSIERIGDIGGLIIYRVATKEKKLFGLYTKQQSHIRAIDREGILRLQLRNGDVLVRTRAEVSSALRPFIEKHTQYGDAGRAIPDLYVLFRGRILDLTGLLSVEHIMSLLGVELAKVGDDERVAAVVRL